MEDVSSATKDASGTEDAVQGGQLERTALVEVRPRKEGLEFTRLLLLLRITVVLEMVDDAANNRGAKGEESAEGTERGQLQGAALVKVRAGHQCLELASLLLLLGITIVLEMINDSADDRCTERKDRAECTERRQLERATLVRLGTREELLEELTLLVVVIA